MLGAVAGATTGVFIGVVLSFFYAFKAGGFHILWVHYRRIIAACLTMVLVLKLLPVAMTMLGLVVSIIIGALVYALVLAPFYFRETKEVLADMCG